MNTRYGLTSDEWLSTRQLAAVYGVAIGTVNIWRYLRGFPETAVRKFEGRVFYHRPTVDTWRDNRPRAANKVT